MNCWTVAAVSFVINFLILGVPRIIPVLFVASMEQYSVNRTEASLPNSVFQVLRTLSGPVTGFLGHKYGLRTITLCGCILSFIGTGVCFFAGDIIAIDILWGGIYGLGCGLGTVLLPMFVDLAFDAKNKTKANGIALAGSSLGGIIIPKIFEASVSEFGFSGSFLIISALILHSVPACLLLSDSSSKKSISKKHKSQCNTKLDYTQSGGQKLNTEKCPNLFYNDKTNTSQPEATKHSRKSSKSNRNTSRGGHDNFAFIKNQNMCFKKEKYNSILSKKFINNKRSWEPNMNSETHLWNRNFQNIPKSMELSGIPRLLQVSVINENDHQIPSEPMKYIQGEGKMTEKEKNGIHESLCIFIDPTFLLIMLTQSSLTFYVMTIFTVIVDVVRDKGVDRNYEIVCVMLFTGSDMIGRLGLGWITDGGYLSLANFCAVSFLLLSLLSLLFIWVYSLALILSAIFLFGFVSGGMFAVHPTVVCEFIGTHNRIMAMTSRMLLLAPMSLAIPPLIGYFREQCRSYDGVFYMSCSISVLCSGMSALIPRVSERSKS